MARVIIREEDYRPQGKESGRGLVIELSPYDMPREVETKYDKDSGVLRLDFKYVDQEEALNKDAGPGLKMRVGKYSGKILGFEFSASEQNIKKVKLVAIQQVDMAIDNALPNLQKFNQRANYKVVRSILDRKREPILASLAAAGA